MTISSPAYILPRSFAVLDCLMIFKSPTGSVYFAVSRNICAKIYSFQNDKKLNNITVMMLGMASGAQTYKNALK